MFGVLSERHAELHYVSIVSSDSSVLGAATSFLGGALVASLAVLVVPAGTCNPGNRSVEDTQLESALLFGAIMSHARLGREGGWGE